ncbi:hypothetical protein [uncultured Microbulbifer sp.]|uniref:hypothetical protein n=1 Tax=uncultured Microbulbifer sp. TaxID=348147 RepID=UPI00262131E7|nr:hypothetical protein [uncultured Microbulbifer sp.]
MREEFKKIIYEGLRKAKTRELDIYTFALCHDHESHVATVCIDTVESSLRAVMSSNKFSNERFMRAVDDGDIESAASWNAISGRSLMVGDFALVNASEVDVPRKPKNPEFYQEMVKAIEEMRDLIKLQSSHGCNLMFCCSTETSEVGLVWS